MSTSQQIKKQRISAYYSKYMSHNTQIKNSFILPCDTLVLAVPPSGTACMPGGWLKEPVRLSSQGFHQVIVPLGIHTTLLPPEAVCLYTDSLKETSYCHFNYHIHHLRFLSFKLPFCFSFIPFLAHSLSCCLSSHPSLCLPAL